MPLSLRVKAPTRRARQKPVKPPIPITIDKGNSKPNRAEVYTPTPKNAAGANEI
jgi:hypothetical protein